MSEEFLIFETKQMVLRNIQRNARRQWLMNVLPILGMVLVFVALWR